LADQTPEGRLRYAKGETEAQGGEGYGATVNPVPPWEWRQTAKQ